MARMQAGAGQLLVSHIWKVDTSDAIWNLVKHVSITAYYTEDNETNGAIWHTLWNKKDLISYSYKVFYNLTAW